MRQKGNDYGKKKRFKEVVKCSSGILSGCRDDTLNGNDADNTTAAGTYVASITCGDKTVSVTYTVAKAEASITAADASKTYGDNDPELTGTVDSVLEDDLSSLEVAYSREAGEDVGTYTITPSYTANSNYDITVQTAKFTISKRTVTVTAEDKSSVYGADLKDLTFTITDGSLADGDSTDALSVTLTKVDGTAVGTYVITGTSASGNYDVTVISGTYTITKAALTVTANDNSITYGDEPSANGVTYSGFVNSENESVLSGKLTYSFDYGQYGDVGAYSITPSGLSSDNYEITYIEGILTVEPKTAELTWSELTAEDLVYDGNEKTLTASVGNLASGDEVCGSFRNSRNIKTLRKLGLKFQIVWLFVSSITPEFI
ncbi:MAG: hypothetical protein LUD12_06860 [Lachnospiraceae bacterium]|nr:hypothetical protein [Lachnospiraceae bacterium]